MYVVNRINPYGEKVELYHTNHGTLAQAYIKGLKDEGHLSSFPGGTHLEIEERPGDNSQANAAEEKDLMNFPGEIHYGHIINADLRGQAIRDAKSFAKRQDELAASKSNGKKGGGS